MSEKLKKKCQSILMFETILYLKFFDKFRGKPIFLTCINKVCLLPLPLSGNIQQTKNNNHFLIFPDITKTCLYSFDPLKSHFYIVKLGFTGVYIIFLISAQKHRLWVLVRTASSRQF